MPEEGDHRADLVKVSRRDDRNPCPEPSDCARQSAVWTRQLAWWTRPREQGPGQADSRGVPGGASHRRSCTTDDAVNYWRWSWLGFPARRSRAGRALSFQQGPALACSKGSQGSSSKRSAGGRRNSHRRQEAAPDIQGKHSRFRNRSRRCPPPRRAGASPSRPEPEGRSVQSPTPDGRVRSHPGPSRTGWQAACRWWQLSRPFSVPEQSLLARQGPELQRRQKRRGRDQHGR